MQRINQLPKTKKGVGLAVGALAGIALIAISPAFASTTPPVKRAVTQAKKTANKAGKAITKTVKTAQRAGRKTSYATTNAIKKMTSTPDWNHLRSAYDYDAGAPEVQEKPVENDKAMEIKIGFTGANGKPVLGIFMRPKAEGTYPCALLPHGLTNNKEIAIKMFGNDLVAKGVAVLALDAPGHGQGQSPNKNYWTQQVIAPAVHEGDRNYRLALDWLATRPDVDSDRIGLLGYSMGSIMGSILGSVDERVKAFALCVGGDPFLPIAHATPDDRNRDAILKVSPSLFISHISKRPIIMFNGLTDVVIVPPAAKILQAAAPQPKEVVWYNGGHDVPQAIRTRAVEWLSKQLKATAPAAPAPKEGDDANKEKPADAGKDDKKDAEKTPPTAQ